MEIYTNARNYEKNKNCNTFEHPTIIVKIKADIGKTFEIFLNVDTIIILLNRILI